VPVRGGIFEDRLAVLRRLGLGPVADVLEALREDIADILERIDELTSLVNEVRSRLDNLEKDMADLRARVSSVEERVSGLAKDFESVEAVVRENQEMLNKVRKRLNRHEITLGALTEATLARIVREELEAEGYVIRSVIRNYRINNEDIDVLVHAEKSGKEMLIAVEIKIKPKHSDVGSLIAKKELIEAKKGTRVIPVLAGVWVGSEVESYAKSKGVRVLKL